MVDLVTGDTRLILDACRKHDLLRNQAAYVLATAKWETAHTMKPVKEAYWLSEAWRKNNLRYYPWYGRGYIQLTWEENYKRAERETGYPIHQKPETALQAEPAAEVLVRGMKFGWFTGKKLSDYITLQKSDFVGARRIVNGTDKASSIAAIAKRYDKLLKAEGYGITPEPTAKPSGGLLAALFQFLANLFRRSA